MAGFRASVVSEIKGTLRQVQVEVGQSARANVSSTQTEVAANESLAESYRIVMAGAQTAIATTKESIAFNRQLAVGYTELAAAAKAGSVERLTYEKLAQEATLKSAATVQETARANVAATAREITMNKELAASYALIGRSAKAGSAEAIAASRLGGAAAASGGGGAAAAGAEGGLAGKAVGKGIGVAGLLGVAIGTAELFKLGKESVKQAGEIQKFREVVTAEFGASGEAVKKFAKDGTEQFAITDDAALSTASRFGILFKNLGIGQRSSATMTIGFEKLAGALAAIRGQDPEAVLGKLPLVAAGNTRALKQLGLAIDQNDIKQQALKMGLIATTKDAVTPAIKAQAVYALATKNLGDYLAQAKAHQDDFANSSRRLHRNIEETKDEIGEGLLPVFKVVTAYLADNLPKAVEYVKGEFASVGPTLRADVKVLEDIWERWGATIKRVVDVNLKTTIAIIKSSLQQLQAIFDIVTGILTGDWSRFWGGLKELPKAALEGVKALVVGEGHAIAAVFEGIWKNIKESVIQLELWIVKQMARLPTSFKVPGLDKVPGLSGKVGFGNPFEGLKGDLEKELEGIKAEKITAAAADAAKKHGKTVGTTIVDAAADTIRNTPVLSSADIAALNAANAKIASTKQKLAAAIAAGSEQVKAASQRLEQYIAESNARIKKMTEDGNAKIVDSARSAAANLVKIGKDLAASIGKYLDTGPTTKAIKEGPLGQQFAALKKLLEEGKGGPEVLRRAQLLSSEMQADQSSGGAVSKQKAAVTRRVNDLTDELNRHLITWKGFQSKLQAYLGSQGITYKKIYGALGRSAADSFHDQLKAAGLQAKAISTENAKVRGLVGKAGGGGSSPIKVIDPNSVALKVQAGLTAANTRRLLGITQHEAALSRAESRSAARTQAARDAVTHSIQKKQQGIAEHTLAATKKIEAHTKATADATKKLPRSGGYPKSTENGTTGRNSGVNPGHRLRGAVDNSTSNVTSGR